MQGLGIDIGGSGIKGAIVDLDKGELIGDRHRMQEGGLCRRLIVGEIGMPSDTALGADAVEVSLFVLIDHQDHVRRVGMPVTLGDMRLQLAELTAEVAQLRRRQG